MKILISHHSKGFHGGAEEAIIQLVKYLRGQGHEVRVVMEKNSLKLYPETQHSLFWADVVNIHNFPATLAPFPFPSYKGRAMVWYCNEPPELFSAGWRKPIEAFNRWWVKASRMKVVVADQYNAERFKSIYGKPVDAIIPYGVDFEFFAQGIRQKRQGTTFKILQAGTISPYKNQMESVWVLNELMKTAALSPHLTFSVVSQEENKSYFTQLKSLIRTLHLEDRVTFTGHLSREEVRELYYSHDALLHPVLPQGGWLTPFETLSTGLPLVINKEFTSSHLIRENNLGLIAESLEGYVQALKFIAFHGGEAGEVSKADMRKEWVKQNLSWDSFGRAMEKIFEVSR